MADIVVTTNDIVDAPGEALIVEQTGVVVVPNKWAVVPYGGEMPEYSGVNADVEARILQVKSEMEADLDTKAAQLLADIQDVDTGLYTERSVRQSEDEALAARIDTEVARIDSNVAAAQSGVIANADNHSALAAEYAVFVAQTDSAIAAANQDISVLAAESSAHASAIGEMQVTMDGRESAYSEAIDLTVTKNYENYFYPVNSDDLPADYMAGDYMTLGFDYDVNHPEGTIMHALADSAGAFDLADWEVPQDQTVPRQFSAVSQKIESLVVATDDLQAQIDEEKTVRADADSALASRTTALEAETNDLSARISTEEQTRADADSALASRTTTLEAEVDGLNVRLTNDEAIYNGYFHVWDGVEDLQIGYVRLDDDGTVWQYLGGNLGENADGWVRTDKRASDLASDAGAVSAGDENLLKWAAARDGLSGWTPNQTAASSLSGFDYVLKQSSRDCYMTVNADGSGGYYVVPCQPGETIYIRGWVNTEGTTNVARIGMRGASGGAAQSVWPAVQVAAAGQGWTYFETEVATPSDPAMDGFIPFTQIPVYDNFGEVLWAGLVYSRTPHKKRVDEISGWAAGASKLIKDPTTGYVTGWSFADGSNVESTVDLHGQNFNVRFPSGARFHVEETGLWFEDSDLNQYLTLKNIAVGVAQNGSTVAISGFKGRQPQIMVSPRNIMTFDPNYSQYKQSINCAVQDLAGSINSGEWTFKPVATLDMTDGEIVSTGNLVGTSCGGSDAVYIVEGENIAEAGTVFSYSSEYTIPANTVTVNITCTVKHIYLAQENPEPSQQPWVPYDLYFAVELYDGASWVQDGDWMLIDNYSAYAGFRYVTISKTTTVGSNTKLRYKFRLYHYDDRGVLRQNTGIDPLCDHYLQNVLGGDGGKESWEIRVTASEERAWLDNAQQIDSNGTLNWVAIG